MLFNRLPQYPGLGMPPKKSRWLLLVFCKMVSLWSKLRITKKYTKSNIFRNCIYVFMYEMKKRVLQILARKTIYDLIIVQMPIDRRNALSVKKTLNYWNFKVIIARFGQFLKLYILSNGLHILINNYLYEYTASFTIQKYGTR